MPSRPDVRPLGNELGGPRERPSRRSRLHGRSAACAALAVLSALVAGSAAQGRDTGFTRVTVFGDSAATAMAYDPDAKRILARGIDLKLEVAACRRVGDASCPYDGVRPPNVIERATELGRELGSVVVVIVGYNDYESRYAENIEAALDAFRKAGVERVIWATLRAGRQSYVSMNDAILAAGKRFPQLTVVDWNGLANTHQEWLQPDGIHLTPEGARGMATMVNDTLVGLGIAPQPAVNASSLRLAIASRALPAARRDRAYVVRLRAIGGRPPYRWAKSGGTLPAGLRLSSDGRLAGIPKRSGSFMLRCRVADRSGAATARTFRLLIGI
jgi:Putative Ig domain